jgi:hypothetical protein
MVETPIQFNDREDVNEQLNRIVLKLTTAPDQDPFSSAFFSKESLEILLRDPKCLGIRFHPALKRIEKQQFLTLVATAEIKKNSRSGIAGKQADYVCPPDCPRTGKMSVKTSMNVTIA